MKRGYLNFISILFVVSLCACKLPKGEGPASTPSNDVMTQIASTMLALTQPGQEVTQASPTEMVSPTLGQPTFTLTPSLTLTLAETQKPTTTATITITPIPKPGSISGSISGYPYGNIPSLAIVAYEQEAPFNYSYWITAPGDTSFTISSQYVIPGKWQVVAYDSDSHAGGCPTIVIVVSDQNVTCDITDWSSSYQAKPSGVPNP